MNDHVKGPDLGPKKSIGIICLVLLGTIIGGAIAAVLTYAATAGICWILATATGNPDYFYYLWFDLFACPVMALIGAIVGCCATLVIVGDLSHRRRRGFSLDPGGNSCAEKSRVGPPPTTVESLHR